MLSILGIQKQDNFAIYDLFALLVIFLHRTILKRLGLWRDYLADDELLLASNEDEKRAQRKQLANIDTNIYRDAVAIATASADPNATGDAETETQGDNRLALAAGSESSSGEWIHFPPRSNKQKESLIELIINKMKMRRTQKRETKIGQKIKKKRSKKKRLEPESSMKVSHRVPRRIRPI